MYLPVGLYNNNVLIPETEIDAYKWKCMADNCDDIDMINKLR